MRGTVIDRTSNSIIVDVLPPDLPTLAPTAIDDIHKARQYFRWLRDQ